MKRSRVIRAVSFAATAALALTLLVPPRSASAFCGFYVAKADTRLFNKASQVVLVRDGDRTVLTMANDFQGDAAEFALVVPVPVVLQRAQIHVGDAEVLAHLDAYTAPRLVEYFDDDPCAPYLIDALGVQAATADEPAANRSAKRLGVTIEARYTVGEYDILILSARQSGGLATWLTENGYRIPPGAGRVLGSYLKQGMKFFVAKVNLREKKRLGFQNLRPLQMAYESPKFMLPIRLGMVNADGPQELFVFALTRGGRVETTNYRTVKLPTGMDVPVFVKKQFGDFYKAMFAQQVRKEKMRAVFLEYAWDMSWCDPCAADPLSQKELRGLGVWWVDDGERGGSSGGGAAAGPVNVFVTRLHLRYDAAHFPEDLVFQQTQDRENFQGRYVLRHPWLGKAECDGAREYRRELAVRREREARALAELTGWRLSEIRRKMRPGRIAPAAAGTTEQPWYERIWQ